MVYNVDIEHPHSNPTFLWRLAQQRHFNERLPIRAAIISRIVINVTLSAVVVKTVESISD